NGNGDLVRFTGGGVKTLRYTVVNGGHNPKFFMLLSADLSQTPPPFVSAFQPDGTTMFQYTNKLAFVANSYVGLTTNNVVVTLDGVQATNLSLPGPPPAGKCTCPVRTNAVHTA